jgi:transglutaminase-like putative cysteine protease
MVRGPAAEVSPAARKAGYVALAVAWVAVLGAGSARIPVGLAAAGLLGALQILLVRRARQNSLLRLCALSAVVQGLLAARGLGDAWAFLPVLATLAASLVWLAVLSEQAPSPSRVPRSGVVPAGGPLRRLGTALGVGAMLLVLAPFLALLASAASGLVARLDPRARLDATPTDPAEAEPRPAPGAQSAEKPEDSTGSFPATLEWASASPVEEDTPVIVVRWTGPAGVERPAALHVRGRVLERFTESGLAARSVDAPLALDGRRDTDGWSPLEPLEEPAHTFEVEQIPLRVGAREESLLFVPLRPIALDCPGALLRGDAELSAPLPRASSMPSTRERLGFRVRSVDRLFESASLPAEGARLASTRALELPPFSDELQTIRTLAHEVTRGARDDRERVARVLAYFRREFSYEPKATGIAGLAGLVAFLERRAGSCTHYAATAALMLRSLGLPTRVATGFLALPEPTEERTYVATLRNGHAWFEVAFEGVGWVTCDATPGGSANPALALAETPTQRRDLIAFACDLARFLGGEPLEPQAFLRALTPRGWAVLVGLMLGAAWIRRLLRRRASEAPSRAESAPSPALERLLAALARAGLPRPPARTLREHAGSLGPLAAPVTAAAEALYRTRFGGSAWSGQDEQALARALAALAETRGRS